MRELTGMDGDRYRVVHRVALAGLHLDRGVVLAVVERKLGAQQLERVVGLALAVTQKAPNLAFA